MTEDQIEETVHELLGQITDAFPPDRCTKEQWREALKYLISELEIEIAESS